MNVDSGFVVNDEEKEEEEEKSHFFNSCLVHQAKRKKLSNDLNLSLNICVHIFIHIKIVPRSNFAWATTNKTKNKKS